MRQTKLEKLIDEKLTDIVNLIYRADKKTVRKTLQKIIDYSTTNCGWFNYWAKDLIIKFMQDALITRKLRPK